MASATFISSGNLIADRRYEWAREYASRGEFASAVDLYTQAVEVEPTYAAAWFALGEVRDRLGDRAGAIAAFEQARVLDIDDRHGAAMHLIRLGARPPGAMPEGYVRALFDGYAVAFDAALTHGLGYCAPEFLRNAVQASVLPMRFGSALDLGCGTGLGGAAFRPYCDWLVGCDLSPAMLAKARQKGLYDRLIEDDVMRCLAAEAAAGARHHLIVAADVFMYFEDLAPLLQATANVLAPAGVLAFNAETHDGGGVILRDTLRYAHGVAYLRAALQAAGLSVVSLDSASTRSEKGMAVPGLVTVARS